MTATNFLPVILCYGSICRHWFPCNNFLFINNNDSLHKIKVCDWFVKFKPYSFPNKRSQCAKKDVFWVWFVLVFFVCEAFIFQPILRTFFFMIVIKLSLCNMPADFNKPFPFSRYKGITMHNLKICKSDYDSVLSPLNSLWDLVVFFPLDSLWNFLPTGIFVKQIWPSSYGFRN